jgi:hypothetical protein
MASIFLSYVREDVDKARAIASLLERRGHSVWWDRHIKGGAQFASEIEAALAAADKVVVLWSARSVSSRWVRDEAAAGGDSARLVPISIDGTEAPLGFRQFHTVDFSRWRGRSDSPQWRGLMEAIASDQALVTRQSTVRHGPGVRVSVAALIAIALVAAVAGGGWYVFGEKAPDSTLVAIAPADGSSSSRQAAHDLTTRLGALAAGSTGIRLRPGRPSAPPLRSGPAFPDSRLNIG